ncbi:hypothetical protein KR032_002419, partial [Drosophila birchii]
ITACQLFESIRRASEIFSISKSAASGVPAITLSAVPRKSRLLAILWCIFKTDNKLLTCSVSTSNNF